MNNYKHIGTLLILFGILYLISLAFVNVYTHQWLFTNIDTLRISKIYDAQYLLIISGVCCILLGFLIKKLAFFKSFFQKTKRVNRTLLLIFLICPLLFIEGILKSRAIFTTQELIQYSVPYQPSTFTKHILPNEDIDILYRSGEVNFKIRNGFHGNDFPLEKPKGEIRIFILGGSFIFSDHQDAIKVNPKHHKNWVQKIENQLKTEGYQNVRIINAGTPAHASFDSLGKLYAEIHQYQPDYVFFCHGWNDIKDFRDLSLDNSLLRLNPGITKSSKDKPSVVETFLEKSQIYLRIKHFFTFKNHGSEGKFETVTLQDSYSELAIPQFELTVNLFIDACKHINAVPVLLTQPTLITANNTLAQQQKIKHEYQGLTLNAIHTAYTEIDASLKKISKERNVLLYDLGAQNTGVDEYFTDHVHLTGVGGVKIAKDLATFIASKILSQEADVENN